MGGMRKTAREPRLPCAVAPVSLARAVYRFDTCRELAGGPESQSLIMLLHHRTRFSLETSVDNYSLRHSAMCFCSYNAGRPLLPSCPFGPA